MDTAEEIKKVFQVFDRDGNGFIHADELKYMMVSSICTLILDPCDMILDHRSMVLDICGVFEQTYSYILL